MVHSLPLWGREFLVCGCSRNRLAPLQVPSAQDGSPPATRAGESMPGGTRRPTPTKADRTTQGAKPQLRATKPCAGPGPQARPARLGSAAIDAHNLPGAPTAAATPIRRLMESP